MPEYMQPYEVRQSVAIGTRVAIDIMGGATQPRYNAAIRHAIATKGIHDATALACQLIGMSDADAAKHIAGLMNSKSDDIVSPYYPL